MQMTIESRDQLKKYCLRALGEPVIKVNVDATQINDRIDDAIEFFRLYHYDGIQKVILKHQITQDDINNGYISISPQIYGISRVYPISTSMNNDLFSPMYQMRSEITQDILGSKGNGSMNLAYYEISMEYLATVQKLLVGNPIFQFNRLQDRLYISMNWEENVKVGEFLVAEAYMVIDPNEFTKMWSEPWFRAYCIALIKIQWGQNLKKFSGIQLVGGVQFDAQEIWQEGTDEKSRLEDELVSKSAPLEFYMG